LELVGGDLIHRDAVGRSRRARRNTGEKAASAARVATRNRRLLRWRVCNSTQYLKVAFVRRQRLQNRAQDVTGAGAGRSPVVLQPCPALGGPVVAVWQIPGDQSQRLRRLAVRFARN